MHGNLNTNDQLICECLDLSWNTTQTLTRSPSFWSVYESLVSSLFQATMLSLPPTSRIQEKLREILEHIVELASSRPAMLQSVCKAFLTSWHQLSCKGNIIALNPADRTNLSDASIVFNCVPNPVQLKVHSDFIFQCIVFNHVPKKEDVALHHVLKLRGLESKDYPGTNTINFRTDLL